MMKMRRFTSQHVELMTKRQDLCLQRRSRPEQSDQRQPNQAENISHQPRASPDSTSLASRIEFPTMTGLRMIMADRISVIKQSKRLEYCKCGYWLAARCAGASSNVSPVSSSALSDGSVRSRGC